MEFQVLCCNITRARFRDQNKALWLVKTGGNYKNPMSKILISLQKNSINEQTSTSIISDSSIDEQTVCENCGNILWTSCCR